MRQIGLFPAADETAAGLPAFDDERAIAARVPQNVHFGTSSWTFPGWSGLVYPPATTEKVLRERGLALYARNPLFRTVGIDRSYYAPLSDDDLGAYAEQLPAGFPCVIKVWSGITTRVDPRSHRPVPTYLDLGAFEDLVLAPLLRSFAGHVGSLVFEFPPGRGTNPLPVGAFVAGLGRFLGELPKGVRYAVEVRNQNYLAPPYFECLRAHGVAHVLNYWEAMPSIGRQLALPGVLAADHVVCRLLLPPGGDYDALRVAYAPFDRIARPDPGVRADVRALLDRAVALGKAAFVIVNNKVEGSSPLTVRALAESFVASPGPRTAKGGGDWR